MYRDPEYLVCGTIGFILNLLLDQIVKKMFKIFSISAMKNIRYVLIWSAWIIFIVAWWNNDIQGQPIGSIYFFLLIILVEVFGFGAHCIKVHLK